MDAGAIVVIVVMVVVMPVALFVSGMVVAGLIGWTATDDAKARYEGSELVNLDG